MNNTIKWKTAKWHDVNDVYNDGYSRELRRYSVCGYYVITTYGDRIWYLKELTSSNDDCNYYTKVWTYRNGDLQFKSLDVAKKYAEEITKGANNE